MNTHRLVTIVCSVLVIGLLVGLIFLPPFKPTQVVVNMPADAQPLASLAPVVSPEAKVITQERAVLWYSVYTKLVDKGYAETAIRAANEAVDKVYGPAKP